MSHRTELTLLVAIVLMIGCSGSHSPIPVLPSDPQSSAQGNLSPSTHSSNHYLWGYYLFYVNPEGGEFEVVPSREIAAHFNALKWLEQVPCTNCVEIVSISPDPSGTKHVEIRIRHPFSTENLTGFDVRGIVMFNGSHTFPVSGLTTPDKSAGDGELVNADGYTTLYNIATEGSGPGGIQGYMEGRFATDTPPSAKLNGYKRYGTYTPANTRNAFYAGDKIAGWYEIMLPSTAFVLGYAVDASWVAPTVKPVTDPMTDFPPSANCPEPWKIGTGLTPIGIGLNTQGGEVKLTLDVYDYQGKDSHGAPVLECPELFDGTKTATCTSDATDFSIWEVVVGNEKLAAPGDYECLTKVVDDENAGSPSYLDLTAYQIATLTVSTSVYVPPVAKAKTHPYFQYVGEPMQFDDDGSYDPDGGSIVKYEWDWENDGVFDEEGASASHAWDTAGTYFVQLRVTDNEGDTDVLDSPLEVPIVTDCGPDGALAWAKRAGGSDNLYDDEAHGIATLSDGSVVVTGCFSNAATFGQGEPNEVTLVSPGYRDIFIARYDPDGALSWAIRAGGANSESGNAIASLTDDSIVITGYFYDSAAFGEGEPDEVTLTSDGVALFIARYNPDGTVAWAKRAGTTNSVNGYGICSLSDDSTAVTGWFSGSVIFGEGEPNETTLASPVSVNNILIARFNPDGTLAWAKRAGGDGDYYDAAGYAITSLPGDSIAITGDFYFEAVFGEGEPNETKLSAYFIYPPGDPDIFVARYNPDGTLAWAKSTGNVLWDAGAGITSFSDGSVAVTGNREYVDGSSDIFLARYGPDGTLTWAKRAGGPYVDAGFAVVTLSDDLVAVTGYFSGAAMFGEGEPNETTLISSGDLDIFVARYNPDGTLVWARRAGGIERDEGRAITAFLDESITVAGWFEGPATFGEDEPNETTLDCAGKNDIFVARFCD